MEPDTPVPSSDTSASGAKQDAVQFEFVHNDARNRTQIRRVAMRAAWVERREKKRQVSQRDISTGSRRLAPAPITSIASSKLGVVGEGGRSKDGPTQNGVVNKLPSRPRKGILARSLDGSGDGNEKLRKNKNTPEDDDIISPNVARLREASLSNSHTWNNQGGAAGNSQALTFLSTSIGSNFLDGMSSLPFRLEPNDLEIVHHWMKDFPRMMYGDGLNSPSYHGHTQVWVPLDISNEAAFHGALAYHSAHLRHLHGESKASPQALMHNLKSIELINSWLNDPSLVINDMTITAVLRQLTLENWWGSSESIKIHRAGLKRMIKLRGGLPSLASNWRLERACIGVLLVREPYWFNPERHESSRFCPIPLNGHDTTALKLSEEAQDLRNSLHEFVQFFNNLQQLHAARFDTNLSNGRYPFVELAVTRLKSFTRHSFSDQNMTSHGYIEESMRLASLFYIAVTWVDSILQPDICGKDLEILDSRLELKGTKGYGWTKSIENLFDAVLSSDTLVLANIVRAGYVLRLMEVSRLLDLPLWNHIKEVLLNTLLGTLPWGGIEIFWNEEELFTQLLGRL